MLERLHIENFTAFAEVDFEFGPGLNVIVGNNGTGKSHVLKLGYAVAQTVAFAEQIRRNKPKDEFDPTDFQLSVSIALSSRLSAVFLPGTQNKLVRNNAGEQDAQVSASFGTEGDSRFAFRIKHSDHPLNSIGPDQPFQFAAKETATPIFIPAKEILSLMPDILGISKNNPDVFDSTYLDLATQLTIRVPKTPPAFAKPVLSKWADIMQGEIQSEDGRFYFYPKNGARFRVGLAAEGFRKLGTLSHLLAIGSLNKNATLFWDEPEANLNPALLRELAKVLAELARQKFQIILATHSMSLLKEFHILSREVDEEALPIKYFGLNAEQGQPTVVVTRDDFKYLPDVVALEVELDQADDLEEIFARENS
ncbi:AAA family ATPase [Hymenobacter siberiensis]|jgi:energy-coupling factor transporter ATP-binding protein EcfA2|uniref:AAA family ATPase n=1 Tax=Hymenobacter siberiensis TaxID=2848396 RepID=UPI001C1DF838|nr:AAA family ATPase [Hymenobacter siberiensis]